MRTKPAVLAAAGAAISLAVCAVLALSVFDTRRMVGRLRRETTRVKLEQQAVVGALATEREQRAVGVLETVRRPVAPELPTILRRVPPALRVEVITATTEYWHITGVPQETRGGETPPSEFTLPRSAPTVTTVTEAKPHARLVP
jgi:hypothetical protein